MKVLFLALAKQQSIDQPGIYTDLLRCFTKQGHEVYLVTADEEETGGRYQLKDEKHAHFLTVGTGHIQQTGLIKKGINTVLLQPRFVRAIGKVFNDVTFDLILYPTPPITFVGVVSKIKKRDGSKTYLLLKDIFPQNAIDMGMLSRSGIKGLIYRHFRKQEKKLYKVSDGIGCMSQANVDYVIRNNPEVKPEIVEVCPNSIEPADKSVNEETRTAIRDKYGIPKDKKVFVYGGNLGRPQGIPFLIECLEKCREMEDVYFLIVGDGTEYHLLEEYAGRADQSNFKLLKRLPKEDYDTMVAACDVGLIFLDHGFTIPNFPSRILSYMQARLPVLACTDPNTDIGLVAEQGGFGWRCESNDSDVFARIVRQAAREDLSEKGMKSYQYLLDHYSVEDAYRKIMKAIGADE